MNKAPERVRVGTLYETIDSVNKLTSAIRLHSKWGRNDNLFQEHSSRLSKQIPTYASVHELREKNHYSKYRTFKLRGKVHMKKLVEDMYHLK